MTAPHRLPADLFGAEVVPGTPDVRVPAPVHEHRSAEYHLRADRDRAFLDIAAVGTFGIECGRRVTVQPAADAEPGIVEVYLEGTVAALLLAQRRCFALHANAVGVDGRVVLVAGASGAGKSTTAIRLLQRGHDHLGDDIASLRVEQGRIALEPSPRGLRVSPETAALLDIDLAGARRQFPSADKLLLPVGPGAPAPVRAIAALEVRAGGGELDVRRVAGAAAVRQVLGHVYRRDILLRLYPEDVFAWATDVASALPVFVITRDGQAMTVDRVAGAIERLARDA